MNYTFELSTDYDFIKLIVTSPSIWPHVTSDGADPQVWRAAEWVNYLLVNDETGKTVGLWAFVDKGPICLDAHVCLLPCALGRKCSDAIFQGVLSWLWKNSECERMIAEIPVCNRLALAYARRNGMKAYGRNPGAWLKNGKRWDVLCVGLSRPYWQGSA